MRKYLITISVILILFSGYICYPVSAITGEEPTDNEIFNESSTEDNSDKCENIINNESSTTDSNTNNESSSNSSSSSTTLPSTGEDNSDDYTYSSSNPEDRTTNTIKRTLTGKEVSSTEYKNSKYNAEYITTETGNKVGIGTLRNFEIVDENGNLAYYSLGSTDNETYNSQVIAKSERFRL